MNERTRRNGSTAGTQQQVIASSDRSHCRVDKPTINSTNLNVSGIYGCVATESTIVSVSDTTGPNMGNASFQCGTALEGGNTVYRWFHSGAASTCGATTGVTQGAACWL